ncbi:MAG: hypothetical protein HQ483_18420 [Rhodospirillales bacterium]|nr:hypothetical protein [Rhodospirillales bacterium]
MKDPISSAASGLISGVAAPLFNLVDELFTSDDERAQAKLKLMQMEQSGKLDTLKLQMSAILAEAQSTDPWTSRARPSFLYIIYVFILASIPMGALSAWDPDMAKAIAYGAKAWLDAIPESLMGLFGVGYLGYTGFRSWDKKNGVTK